MPDMRDDGQVGKTGKVVDAREIYVAIGIYGAITAARRP